MALIEREVELVGTKGHEKVVALFDSGASFSCIRPDLAAKLENIQHLVTPFAFETARAADRVEVTERVLLDFHLNGYRFSDEFYVVPDLSEEVIIGAATLQKWRLRLDFEQEEVIVDPRVMRYRL